MSKDYLAPHTGAGLRPSVVRGTGPSHHGRMINPPRFAKFGGFTGPNVHGGPHADPQIRIHKPGNEK